MTILSKADKLINGQRAELYGPPSIGWGVVAKLWGDLLGVEITTKQCLLMMVLLKVSRENEKQDEDNLIDGAGYFGVIEKLLKEAK